MHHHILVICVLVITIFSLAQAKPEVTCQDKAPKDHNTNWTYVGPMLDCLQAYRTSDWNGTTCSSLPLPSSGLPTITITDATNQTWAAGFFKGHNPTYTGSIAEGNDNDDYMPAPEACYDACHDWLQQVVNQGATDVQCDVWMTIDSALGVSLRGQTIGMGHCWMGFHPLISS
ncbi:MAG: hypothetical protein M1827_004754 [Pycnora praestabilis]|nr:MAG: hypothetical protein M1827_004754 [Pycnora praestabilis]